MSDDLVTTILDRGARHAVVEASAGTGKTYTLEHLYVGLIERGLDAASILVMTFTDKATRELRERIHARLIERQSEALASARARERCRAALEQFDSAPIRTLNAFCLGVLREHAFALGRPLEETLVREHYVAESALRTLLRRELQKDDADARTLAQTLNRYGEAKLARALYDLHVAHCEGATILPRVPSNWRDVVLRELAASAPLAPDQALIAQIEHALSDRELNSTFSRLAEKLLGTSDNSEAFVRLRNALLDASDAIESPLAPLLMQHLPRFAELFEEHLTKTQSLTHTSVQRDTLALLRTHEHALADLRDRYRYALVDEFQDVDVTQWALLSLLFVERTQSKSPWVVEHRSETSGGVGAPREEREEGRLESSFAGSREGAIAPSGKNLELDQRLLVDALAEQRFDRRLFAIGDPKQAIYGFRGADVQLYWDASQALEQSGEASMYALADNFRSTPRLLRVVNEIVENDYFHGPNRYATPSVAARPETEDPAAPLVVYQVSGTREIQLDTARPALIDEYVCQIARLRTSGVLFADILILARTSTECSAVAQALRAAHIECVWKSDKSLWATREARALATLLAALLDPTPARIRACLIEPFLGLPLAHLVEYDAPQAVSAHRVFAGWLELVRSQRLVSVLREVRQRMRGKPHAANYAKLTRKLAAWHVGEQLGLDQLELRLRLASEGFEEGLVGMASENAVEAVRVMTIHGAKGLQADYVFLFGGYHENYSHVADVARFTSDGARVAYLGKPGLRMRAVFRQKQQEEEERLYYVALTRAKERVYLSHWGAPPMALRSKDAIYDLKQRLSGGYRTVNARLESLMDRGRDVEVRVLHVRTSPLSSSASVVFPATPSELHDETGASTTTTTTLSLQMGADYTSYSRMKAMVRNETRFFAEAKPHTAHDEMHQHAGTALPTGAEYGVFVHSILEHAPWQRLLAMHENEFVAAGTKRTDTDAILRTFSAQVQDAAFLANVRDANVLEMSLRMVFRTLSTEVRCGEDFTLARGLRSLPEVQRETPFLHPLPKRASGTRNAFVRGILDMTFVHEGKLFILDWKSDALPNYQDATLHAHVAAEYQAQARLYAIAGTLVAASHTATKLSFGGVLYTFLRAHEDIERTDSATLCLPANGTMIAQDWTALTQENAFGYPLPRYAVNDHEESAS